MKKQIKLQIMASTIITALVGLFCTLASSIVTFLFTRKKYNEEVVSQKIDNLNKTFDLTQKMYEATTKVMKDKIAIQDNTINQLLEENERLKKQVSDLQIKVAKMFDAMCYDTTCNLRKNTFPFDTPPINIDKLNSK